MSQPNAGDPCPFQREVQVDFKWAGTPWWRWSVIPVAVAALGGAGLVVVTIAGFLANVWWVFELCSHFRVQYFILLAISAAVLWLSGGRRSSLVLAGFAGANLCLIVPLYEVPDQDDSSLSRPFTAVIINVLKENQNYDLVQNYLMEKRPDMVVLVEMTPAWEAGLRELERWYPYSHLHPAPGALGIAVYSRFPMESQLIHLGRASAIMAHVKLDRHRITVVGVHLTRPGTGPRYLARQLQVRQLATLVRRQRGPLILLGDMNTTSWSPVHDGLTSGTGLRDSRPGFGVQPTWPRFPPWLRIPIDHVMVTRDIRVLAREVGPGVGSDHFPVRIRFAITDGATSSP